MTLGTLNVRSIRSNLKYVSQTAEETDLLFIQEHWLTTHNLHLLNDISSQHHVIGKTSDSITNTNTIQLGRGKGGIATLIRKSLISECSEVPCHSSRINIVRIHPKCSKQCILAINCYMPAGVNQADLIEYQESLAIISNVISSHREDSIIIAGDFNADTVNPNNKKSLGYLRTFLKETGFTSITEEIGTRGGFTFRSDDGTKTSYIDGFLTPRATLHEFTTLIIGPDVPLNTSDHQLVKSQWSKAYQCDTQAKQTKHASSMHPLQKLQRLKIKWKEVSKQDIVVHYTAPLEDIAKQVFTSINDREPDNTMIDDLLHTLTTAMIETSLCLPHSYPSSGKRGKPEWSSNVKAAYKASLKAWKNWKVAGKPLQGMIYQQYLECKKEFRRQLRQSRAHNHRKLLQNIENASESDQRLFYHLLKTQRPNNSGHTTETLEYDGTIYQEDIEIIEGWRQYFTDLSRPDPTDDMISITNTFEMSISSPPSNALRITSHDLKEAITKLKKGKACGPDNISPEHLIHMGEATTHLILLIFNYYLATAHTTQHLKKGLILPFHKGKGKDPQDPRNYRGITLTSSLSPNSWN